MQIVVAVDDERLIRYAQRGQPLAFTIYWEHDGEAYPDDMWSDFGVIVLGWWCRETARMLGVGNAARFQFMDGPYAIRAHYHRGDGMVELQPERRLTVWRVPMTALAQALIRATNEVSRELRRVGVGEADRVTLDSLAAHLRTYVDEA